MLCVDSLMEQLSGDNLQLRVPDDHPLLTLYRNVLVLTHPNEANVVNNYTAIVARVLRFATDRLTRDGRPPANWCDLVTSADPIVEYLAQ